MAATGGAKASQAMTKSELVTHLAAKGELEKKTVTLLLDELATIAAKELKSSKRKFKIPGVVSLVVVDTPAKPARQGRNPATGETMMFKPKPASRKVKARIPKELKDAV